MKIDPVFLDRPTPANESALRTARAIIERLCVRTGDFLLTGDCWVRWAVLVGRKFLRDPDEAAAALAQLQAIAELSDEAVRHEEAAKSVSANCRPMEEALERMVAYPPATASRGGRAVRPAKTKAKAKASRSPRRAAKGGRSR